MNQPPSRNHRKLVLSALFAISNAAACSSFAAVSDLSATPMGTSATGTVVKPNILFILDSSGSMDWDFVPDNVDPTNVTLNKATTASYTCRNDTGGNNACNPGDPPYYADKFNQVSYNPQSTYKAGVNFDGSTRGNKVSPWTSVPVDDYNTAKGNINLTTSFPEVGFKASGGTLVKRNGLDNINPPAVPGGTTKAFAYATPPGAPITSVSLSRSSSTVTGTKALHGLQVGDVIDVTAAGGCNANAVSVTAATANTFTYTYGDANTQPACTTPGTVNYSVRGYPEQADVAFQTTALSKASSTVTVTFPNHGFVVGDVIDVTGGSGTKCTAAGVLIASAAASTFTFTHSTTSTPCGAGTYTVTRHRYNITSGLNGRPFYFTLSPTEYCSDLHLIECVASKVPVTVSGKNYSFPAYVRYCSSSALATQAAPVSTPLTNGSLGAGTAKCLDKYFGSFTYPRYGMFTRGDIVSTGTYSGRPDRTDCTASTCTFTQEMTNFANWYSYYRRRIQEMKTSAGLSFLGIDDRFRVGFNVILPASRTSSVVATTGNCTGTGEFVPVDTFNATQKSLFYCTFYNSQPSGATPLPEALSRAGRYFAGKKDNINGTNVAVPDPIQYSCQQNFALLTTDGYWNNNSLGTPSGAVDINLAAVGNQDNNLSDPSGLVSLADGTYDGGCAAGNPNSAAGGCSNTLADVAMYYYKTDLRDASLTNSIGALGADVTENNVQGTTDDPAIWQHMTTFTLGLADGLMTWQTDYDKGTTGDFFNIKNAATGKCYWSGGGACTWPTPVANTPSALDDLWHAAVNGHGQYFHAGDPQSLAKGLGDALASMAAHKFMAAASATSTPNITQVDNVIYSTSYVTVEWSGEVTAQYVDPVTGIVAPAILFSAMGVMDGSVTATTDTRTIYTFDSTAPGNLKSFLFTGLTTTEKNWLNNSCGTKVLSQCATLTATQLTTINDPQFMLEFLRGQHDDQILIVNPRTHVLGDTVNATPAYVRAPTFNFTDAVLPPYAIDPTSFKILNASRQPVLYVAANDGMLHAIDARLTGGTGGAELWAYVPRMLMNDLYKLADINYASNHQFFVDGSPQVMDVYLGASWRTMLVGGLNKGGRGYYALDVTDPNAPKAMWEFCNDNTRCAISDPDLGLTYGNAVITKRASDGKWVVLVTSGYNNVSPGTGRGYLFILDALTGAVLQKLDNGAGSTTSPSGLGRISAYADDFQHSNTAKYVYGGDMAGNVWRFDLTVSPATALKLGTLNDATGRPQSVTTRPELALINGTRVIYIGTGRYLGITDLTDPATWIPASTDAYQQSIYAFKDLGSNYGNIRTSANLQLQTIITVDSTTRTASNTPVDMNVKNGWYVDFNPGGTSPGERMNLDPQLVLGTLVVSTNVPNVNACTFGGDSWGYQFNYASGAYVSTAPLNVLAKKIVGSLTVGTVIVSTSTGLKRIDNLQGPPAKTGGVNIAGGPMSGRRIGWRELTQ